MRLAPLAAALAAGAAGLHAQTAPPDYSGLAWVEADTFLVVHDAKVPEEGDRTRVGLLVLPPPGGPVAWRPLDVAWPAAHGPAHDLESVARIPGTRRFLLAESGDNPEGEREANGAAPHRHLFLATYARGRLTVEAVADWPRPVTNVEGTAVVEVGGRLFFVYAERAHGRDTTHVAWAPLALDPVRFGPFTSVPLTVPHPRGPHARPVSALDVDGRGRLYAAAAHDPDLDAGPFRSAVWEVGAFAADGEGLRLVLHERPVHWATLDGLKVEAIAVRERGGTAEVFVGTDDEDWGAAIRALPTPATF